MNINIMTSVTKKAPSWIRASDSDDESIADRKQLREEQEELKHEQTTMQNERVEKSAQNVDEDDDDDDDDEEENRTCILPANLQVQPQTTTSATKRGAGLFRRGRRSDTGSITTDHPHAENAEISSVASYMKGFSGNTIESSATASSILSVLSRMMTLGFTKKSKDEKTNDDKNVVEADPSHPSLRLKMPLLAPSRKDTAKKSLRRDPTPPRPESEVSMDDQVPDATVHSSIPDPTPTHKSISTMDTEECTFEGGIPPVIYCFIKVNPYDQDENDDDWNNSGGLRALLPNAIAKRLPKRKQKAKTFIDEDDEESYFQTLIAL